jgi:hypothetical protein
MMFVVVLADLLCKACSPGCHPYAKLAQRFWIQKHDMLMDLEGISTRVEIRPLIRDEPLLTRRQLDSDRVGSMLGSNSQDLTTQWVNGQRHGR